MEQPARSHNKRFWIWTVTVIVAYNCGQNGNVAPAVFFNQSQHFFQTKQGITYLNDQPFSGRQFGLYENGDTAFITPYCDGKENGIAKAWYENKQLKEIRKYKRGKKTGTHSGWWPGGQQKFCFSYRDDVYEGEVKEWYSSGSLFKWFHYKNGQEEGLQQQYFANGSPQFNYVAKEGRNYGLTGVKNCVNVRDIVITKK